MKINKKNVWLFVAIISISTFSFSIANAEISNKDLSKRINRLGNKAEKDMAVPVAFGVTADSLVDTYGDGRSGGRKHEGIDIFAPRGTIIASPSKAVVTKITDEGLGGIQVWTANPGGQRFYYAHLSGVFPDLEVGDRLEVGSPIGFVGNTGNASGASPHLHLGIYDDRYDAINPYGLFDKEFTKEKQIDMLKSYLKYLLGELKKEQNKN